MQKIKFPTNAAMWRFLENNKIEIYTTDSNQFIATVTNLTQKQREIAVLYFNGKLI